MKSQPNGVIIIDKPAGLSSARVVATVKRVLQVAKAGHTGTLDPFATGVMVCPVNRATRLARFMLHGNKTYTGVLKLGTETDTQDSTGAVTARNRVPPLDRKQLDAIFETFTGTMEQVPPAYSALKHHGVPLYRLARQGRPVSKPARAVVIFSLTIQTVALPRVSFEVACSGGTYIRTLCADIGTAIGCGGHLESLRRTRSGPFSLEQAVSLEKLADHHRTGTLDRLIVPMAQALPDLPELRAGTSLAQKIAVGGAIGGHDLAGDRPSIPAGGHLKVVGPSNELLAVLEAQPDGRYRYCCVLSG